MPLGGILEIPRTARLFRTARGFANASVRVTRDMHSCRAKKEASQMRGVPGIYGYGKAETALKGASVICCLRKGPTAATIKTPNKILSNILEGRGG